MNEDKRLSALILGIALFLLGLGSLVTGQFPLGRSAGWTSGFEALVLSIVVLVLGALLVYLAIRNLGKSTRAPLLGEPANPEEGLRILARRYQEQGETEESLKTLAMLYERQKNYEQLEIVQKQLKDLQSKKNS